jgi:hypothetical protein
MTTQTAIISNIVACVEAVVPRTQLGAEAFRHDNAAWHPKKLDEPRTFSVLVSDLGSISGHLSARHESSERRASFDLTVVYDLRAGDVAGGVAALMEDADDLVAALEDATLWDKANTHIISRTAVPDPVVYNGEGFAMASYTVTIKYEV